MTRPPLDRHPGAARLRAGGLRLILVLASLALWAGAGPAAEAAPSPRRAFVVGALLDLSGKGGAAGREARDALLLEVDRLNSRPDGGDRIQLITVDTKSDPGEAEAGFRKLAGEFAATAVLGPALNETAAAAAEAAEIARVPLISIASSMDFYRPPRRWVFSTAHSVALAARRTLRHMRSKGIRRLAILTASDKFGSMARMSLASLSLEMGISIYLDERYAPKEHNFLPYLKRAAARGAGGLILWDRGPAPVAMIRARRALDLRLEVYLIPVISEGEGPKEGGRALEGVFFPISRMGAPRRIREGETGWEEIDSFRNAFRRRFGRLPGGYAGYAADAVRIAAEALFSEGADRERVRNYIEERPAFDGLTGRYRFSPADHNGLGEDAFLMVRIEGGKWVLDEEEKKSGGK